MMAAEERIVAARDVIKHDGHFYGGHLISKKILVCIT